MKRLLSLLIAVLLTTVVGCTGGGSPATGGTETGNTTAVSIRVIGYQSSQLAALDLPALTVGSLEVDTAFVVLDRLRFRPLSACQEDGEDEGAEDIRFDGPFVVDLLHPEALSGLEGVAIPTGRYCRIELVLKKLEEAGAMQGRSVLIEGKRADDTPFRMTTEVDEEFKLENETTGFAIEGGGVSSIFFIAFDLDHWFDGVDLSSPSVEVSSGPIVLIDDDHNEDVQEVIEENLKHSADLFEDSDDDEDLDPEEQENPLAAGTSVP